MKKLAALLVLYFAQGLPFGFQATALPLMLRAQRRTDREIGGTHYTLLASLEVWGKLPLAALSGVIAQGLGYPALFAIGTALCVAFSLLLAGVRTRLGA